MSSLLGAILLAMTSAEAMLTLLNSPSSVSAKTYERAREMVEVEAKKGRPLQQFIFGVTQTKEKKSKDYLEASRPMILEMAEKRNNPLAWYLLSMEKNDLRMLKRAADGGNVQALNALGTIATTEALAAKIPPAERDRVLRKSFSFFGQAAAQRDPNGFINLGACYSRGLGCEPDLMMAFECYRSAAELGHPEGMDNLSACYQLGHGVEKSDEMSLVWRMRAKATRGDEAAAKWLRERK